MAQPVFMASNNAKSQALTWAKDMNLETLHLSKDQSNLLPALQSHAIDMIILSGYMKLIPAEVVEAFPKAILNIHPALLPKYGGKGMYGRNVHDAVIENGESESGMTIHYVDAIYDNGDIIAQKTIPLTPDETTDSLEDKVKAAEPEFYVQTLKTLL